MAERAEEIVFTHGHLFGAVGGGARGFNDAAPRLGMLQGRFRCVGSIDVDRAACEEFERHVGVKATCRDLFDLEQYLAFHGRMPPPGWIAAMPADVRVAMQNITPDVGFLSAPCKGFSGLLPESTSLTDKYQALNGLTLRGVWLWLEAFQDDPTPLLFFENVPRIATRGRFLLDQIVALLQHYGYATAETTHDCGELGGLLSVRETWHAQEAFDDISPTEIGEVFAEEHGAPWCPIRYVADGRCEGSADQWQESPLGKVRVSIHMPRWASRLTLEITDVRVERLQDISDADGEAEGIREPSLGDEVWFGFMGFPRASCPPKTTYAALWMDINGRASWDANPWVWVVSFKPHPMNIDALRREKEAA